MKQFVKQPSDDLFQVLWSLEGFFREQFCQVTGMMGLEREKVSLDVGGLFVHVSELFRMYADPQVRALVSRHTIGLVKRQIGLAKQQIRTEQENLPVLPCTKRFCRSHGLPCSHDIKKLILTGGRLDIKQFHKHWLLSSRREIEAWIDEHEGHLAAADTCEVILPPTYDYHIERDGEVILNPPRRPYLSRKRKKPRPSHRSEAVTQVDIQAACDGDELVPETQPSGRMSTSAEIHAGPTGSRTKQVNCRACGRSGCHNATLSRW